MKRVHEIEQFYDKKYSKEDLVNAINCIDHLYPRFEGFLQECLTICECILTYLSYCAAAEKFSYAWKGFGSKIDAEGTIRLANSFVKSKTISKKQAEMAIRVFFSKRQKAAVEQWFSERTKWERKKIVDKNCHGFGRDSAKKSERVCCLENVPSHVAI